MLPLGIEYLGIVLFVAAETDSYALAGGAAASFGFASGIAQPILGRYVERHAGERLFIPLAFGHAAGIATFVLLGSAGAPGWALIVAAVVPGALSPPILQALRALWPAIAREDKGFLSAAYALDAVGMELIFVAGPLVAGAAALTVGPALALLVGGGFAIAGTIGFVRVRSTRGWALQSTTARSIGIGALAFPGMRTVAAVLLLSSLPIGLLEVAVPALAEDVAQPGVAGPLLALWGIGGIVGGILYGTSAAGRRADRTWPSLLSLQALGFLLLAALPLLGFALLVGPSGLFAAPIMIVGSQLTTQLVPASARVEAFGWTRAALICGGGLGAAAAGIVVEGAGWRGALFLAAAVSLLGAIVSIIGRKSLGGHVESPSSAASLRISTPVPTRDRSIDEHGRARNR